MRKAYVAPVVEKVMFDYKAQIVTTSPVESCFESVMNERPGGTETTCVGGTPISLGWTEPQTLV